MEIQPFSVVMDNQWAALKALSHYHIITLAH